MMVAASGTGPSAAALAAVWAALSGPASAPASSPAREAAAGIAARLAAGAARACARAGRAGVDDRALLVRACVAAQAAASAVERHPATAGRVLRARALAAAALSRADSAPRAAAEALASAENSLTEAARAALRAGGEGDGGLTALASCPAAWAAAVGELAVGLAATGPGGDGASLVGEWRGLGGVRVFLAGLGWDPAGGLGAALRANDGGAGTSGAGDTAGSAPPPPGALQPEDALTVVVSSLRLLPAVASDPEASAELASTALALAWAAVWSGVRSGELSAHDAALAAPSPGTEASPGAAATPGSERAASGPAAFVRPPRALERLILSPRGGADPAGVSGPRLVAAAASACSAALRSLAPGSAAASLVLGCLPAVARLAAALPWSEGGEGAVLAMLGAGPASLDAQPTWAAAAAVAAARPEASASFAETVVVVLGAARAARLAAAGLLDVDAAGRLSRTVVVLQESLFESKTARILADACAGAGIVGGAAATSATAVSLAQSCGSAVSALCLLSPHFASQAMGAAPRLLEAASSSSSPSAGPAGHSVAAACLRVVVACLRAVEGRGSGPCDAILDAGALAVAATVLAADVPKDPAHGAAPAHAASGGTPSTAAQAVPAPSASAAALALLAAMARASPASAAAIAAEPADPRSGGAATLAQEIAARLGAADAREVRAATAAVGNCAFRSGAAAAAMAGCAAALSRCLEHGDVRTRRNAAGAAGNLVRHGAGLLGELTAAGVPQRLVRRAVHDGDDGVRAAALFSLGTVGSHPEGRALLLGMRPSLRSRLEGAERPIRSAGCTKALARLRRKLGASA